MFSKQELLDTAKASPVAVAAHDREGWLSLFSADAEVHDPVGSRAHAGRLALERFYDTFIAPNEIRFRVDHDIVCGQSVVRDLVIETRMGGTALQVDVPLFIRYEIVAQDGEPKVRRLYAHWELLPMMTGQIFSAGLSSGLIALVKLSGNMLKHQGLGGAMGFSRAFLGVGKSAKRSAANFLQAMACEDPQQACASLNGHAQIRYCGKTTSLAELAELLRGVSWEKMLAGGSYVSARLKWDDAYAVVLFDFGSGASLIKTVTIYRASD